jgi:HPt (histidine-containing phosphotransfer) domain-containing protein
MAGMNDFMQKPVREEELYIALENAIEFQKQRGVPLTPMPPLVPVPAPVAEWPVPRSLRTPQVSVSAPKGLSADELLAMAGLGVPEDGTPASVPPPSRPSRAIKGNPNLSPEARHAIEQQFLRDAPLRFKEMKESLSTQDAAVLARGAHSLKSMSRYVSAPDLSEICAEIETLADEGKLADCTQRLEAAELVFAELQSRLQAHP